MKNRMEKLEQRLRQHRGTKDRTSLLEARVQSHRATRASQKERRDELLQGYDKGVNNLKWDFVESTPMAAVRWDEIGALDASISQEVVAAIAFPTGVISLDMRLGGGISSGAAEIYGEESVGKTSLLITMIHSAQQHGRETALCPTEYFDAPYFEKLGVDLSKLLLIRGKGEEVLEEAGKYITGSNRALFIDSATGLRPTQDLPGNWRIMIGTWLAAVYPQIPVDSAVVMANQVRARRSVDPKKMFVGGTDSTAKRIANLFDTRLAIARSSVTETHYDMIIDIVNNNLRGPSTILDIPVVKGKGIDVWLDLVRVAAKIGVLEQHGSWYYYEKTTVAQGEVEVAKLLETNKDVGKIIWEDTLRLLSRG